MLTGAELFERAAEWLDRQPAFYINGVCHAIWEFNCIVYGDEIDLFEAFFRDNPRVYWLYSDNLTPEENKQVRVLALLFMAEIWKDGFNVDGSKR